MQNGKMITVTNVKWVFKITSGHLFWSQWKAIEIIMLAFRRDTEALKTTRHLTPEQNPGEYQHKHYIARNSR